MATKNEYNIFCCTCEDGLNCALTLSFMFLLHHTNFTWLSSLSWKILCVQEEKSVWSDCGLWLSHVCKWLPLLGRWRLHRFVFYFH